MPLPGAKFKDAPDCMNSMPRTATSSVIVTVNGSPLPEPAVCNTTSSLPQGRAPDPQTLLLDHAPPDVPLAAFHEIETERSGKSIRMKRSHVTEYIVCT